MTEQVLEGATNQFAFKELPNSKIILSEEAYTRLSSAMNLCAYSSNQELEYGTFLYGKKIRPNVIYLEHPSEYENYLPKSREFDPSYNKNRSISNMRKELLNKINDNKYNCIAYVHTHPCIDETCRFFSLLYL